MAFEHELDVFLRARYPLVAVVTIEEERAVESVRELCGRTRRKCFAWDIADGFAVLYGEDEILPRAKTPVDALDAIGRTDTRGVFVLRDFHLHWDDAPVRRKLRNLAQRLKYTRKSILVVTPSVAVPLELKDDMVAIELPPPDLPMLDKVLTRLLRAPGVSTDMTDEEHDRLLGAAKGLTASQAQRVFAMAIVRDGRLQAEDVKLVAQQKKLIIRESQALEFYDTEDAPREVGGLDALKRWLRQRRRAFSREAEAYGLPPLRGIALIGIPGTGKSLCAKMIAGEWCLPLIRLDVGSLFGSMMGESEERAREALKLAEAVAPCVLWIDEIEKALAHGGGGDSGVSTRIFGSILTWMQEKTAPVFVVATANDIARLPPELLRRGRFDEVFFLDLPNTAERAAIFAVHLRKRGRDPAAYDLDALAAESADHVGAEIEQAITDAMYAAFDENREFTTADVLRACQRLVPLVVSQKENITGLRRWLEEGRARSASLEPAVPDTAAETSTSPGTSSDYNRPTS